MKYRENQIFCLKDPILLAVFEEGGVVFDLDSRACHELNTTGAQILNLLNGRRNIREVMQTFAKNNRQSIKVVEKDFDTFLGDLIERGWVYAK